jgi:hypothetical protein
MSQERVVKPWVFTEPDEDGDVEVTAANNVTVSTSRTFMKHNH